MNTPSDLPHHIARIRSAWPDILKGKELTDKRIAHYARQGYYGEQRRLRQVAADAVRKSPKSHRPKRGSVALAMAELDNL